MAASVCPVLLNTPPSFAFNGNICPGLAKSKDFVLLSINAFTVADLSEADIPVVTPLPRKSTYTVNAVSIGSVLLETIIPNSNSLHRNSVKGAQIKPRP